MRERAKETDFAELAVAVYVEELAVDKRVLYVGDGSTDGAERLARVAKSVDLVSPRGRARGSRRGGRVSTRRWPSRDDTGRWDLVLVPDLGSAGLQDEEKLTEASRWLTKDGILVAGTWSDGEGAVGYERFYELLLDSFESVRMVGQAPFAGYSVVDFAPKGELEVTFDGSLLASSGETARRYLALCADRDVVLDSYAVVQIPAAEAAAPAVAAPAREPDRRSDELAAKVREQQEALDAAGEHAEGIERELETAREDLGSARRKLDSFSDVAREAKETRARLERKIEELSAARARASAQASEQGSGGATDQEYARLETALRECGRELSVSRVELERRQVLVRDLVEELREAQRASGSRSVPPTDPTPSTTATDPVTRAVAAEAEKAELGFRLDEVRGQLAVSERRAAGELEELRRMEAALRGTVRGINARLAEVTELFQQSQARLALLEDDRTTSQARIDELTRQLGMARERLELEIARAHTTAQSGAPAALGATDPSGLDPAAARTMAQREGSLMGQLVRAKEEASALALEARQAQMESEVAKQAVAEHEERIAGLVRGYRTRLAELADELDRVGSDAERALIAEGEQRSKIEALARSEAGLRGELEGARLRLADREAAVAELTASADGAAVRSHSAPEPGELDRLRDEIARLREELTSDAPDTDEARAALKETLEVPAASERLALAQAALIARLQAQLATTVAAQRSAERDLDHKEASLEEHAEAVESAKIEADVHVGQTARELEEMMDRLEESETARRRAVAALEDSKAILAKLMKDLPEAGVESNGGGAELRGLRDRVNQLDAEAADRELLLRSLTAQLQERDDRLRALDRLQAGDGAEDDPEALRARLLEMEERAARLSEELEHERDARRRLEQS